MQSSYKRLGDYIREIKIKNIDLKATLLLGINIDKFFMPSVANVVGTDMANYRIVSKNQFACNRMHVGRDYRIPIALSNKEEPFMVSPAYDVFEIVDQTFLLPEYLMMWFSRKEFDRNAWFHTDADVRGGLPWKAFCDLKIPIPSPERQLEIVKEYHVIQNRIKLNNQLITKLEETAQAIYKQWFVDFEFPDENGLPYKSNGGEMVESELGEIPKGWRVENLSKLCVCLDNLRRPLSRLEREKIPGNYRYFGAMSVIGYINDFIYDGVYLLISEDGANIVDELGRPALKYVYGKFWLNNHAHIIQGIEEFSTEFLMLALKKINVSHLVTGAAQPKINQQNLMSLNLLKSRKEVLTQFNSLIRPIFKCLRYLEETNFVLNELNSLLLAKMTKVEIEELILLK